MLKLTPAADAKAFVPTSVLLQRLHDEAPPDRFTLDWVMRSLHRRGFGLILLLLALVAIAPGVSIVAGLLLMFPAFQMIAGRPAPVFPRRIAVRPLPTRHLAALVITPIPLSNVVPAFVIALISLAYLEEDGILLSIALLAGIAVLAVALMAVLETIRGAEWIYGLW